MTLDLPLTRSRTRKAPQGADGNSAPSQAGKFDQRLNRTESTGDPKLSTAGPSTDVDPALSGDGYTGDKPSALTGEPNGENKIQILDFHTRNPLISYQGQVYSCAWGTTIGTDVLLTHPSSAIPYEPELKLKGVNVLASTGIKLLGTPVQLVPKRDLRTDQSTRKAEVAAINEVLEQRERQAASNQQDGDVPMSDVAKGKQPVHTASAEASRPPILEPLRLPIGPQNGRAKNLQARFLERIANAKASRGDTDKVILNSKKKITGSGWRAWYSQRDDAARDAGQEGSGDDDGLDELEGEDGAEDGNGDAVEDRAPGLKDGERPQNPDAEMQDGEASIDSDDPEELLFPTKRTDKGKQKVVTKQQQPGRTTSNNATFEASKDLYLTPAERDALQIESTSRRGASSVRGRGRGRGGRGGRGSRGRGSRGGKVVVTGAREGDLVEDGDVQMGGT